MSGEFSWRRARAVCWKDLLDLSKNKALLASLFALPAVLVVVPAGVVWGYLRDPKDSALRTMALYYEPGLSATADAARVLIDRALVDWFGLYLIMPVFVPILISSHAVAGEKERRTLEPLLASPVTAAELVVGKSLASLLPAYGISLAAFGMLCLAVDAVSWPRLGELLLPNALWLFGVLVLSPLFAFFGNGVAVVVSARVGDARLAQQLAGLVVLPLVGLTAGQVAGLLRGGVTYYALMGAAVLVADVALVFVAVRLFDRERLISRWT